jgi:hypothetical protein
MNILEWQIRMHRPGAWLATAGFLVLMAAGCGARDDHPPRFPVTGIVTYQGKAVEGADVVFVPDRPPAQAAFGKTDAQGKYRLTTIDKNDGAVSGNYKVKVSKLEAIQQEGSNIVSADTEAEAEIYRPEDGDVVRIPKQLLPKKYSDHNTSGLTHTVGSAASTLDIVIK